MAKRICIFNKREITTPQNLPESVLLRRNSEMALVKGNSTLYNYVPILYSVVNEEVSKHLKNWKIRGWKINKIDIPTA